MNRKLEKASLVGMIIAVIIAVVFFIYSCYWVAKTVSYSIFYEDMVQQTITEMVKPESLREKIK